MTKFIRRWAYGIISVAMMFQAIITGIDNYIDGALIFLSALIMALLQLWHINSQRIDIVNQKVDLAHQRVDLLREAIEILSEDVEAL